jgi:hypothetical protein
MSFFACSECQAIDRELREAAGELQAAPGATGAASQELIDWLSQLDEEECARMREGSRLWKTWRRLRDHRVLTGHSVPLPLPPNAISNGN